MQGMPFSRAFLSFFRLARNMLVECCHERGNVMVWKISKSDIPHFALGAKFLGSGGGGDTYTLQHLIQSMMGPNREIAILSFSSLSPTDHVVPVSSIGSSKLCDEKLSTGEEGLLVLHRYEEVTGKKADVLMPFNMGGGNALIPFLVAAQNGLPVLDGDGIGRTFPEIHMTPLQLAGVKAGPIVLCNQHLEWKVLTGEESVELSREARRQVTEMGGIVYEVAYAMSGLEARTSVIPGTLKLIWELGRIASGERDHAARIQQLSSCLANSVFGEPIPFIQGKIHGIKRWFVNGTVEGSFEVMGTELHEGERLEIRFANEYVSAWQQGEYRCLTPDLLLLLDEESGTPCLVDDIQEGLPVTVFGIPAPNPLRTGEMLRLVGPEAFGVETPYCPVELLARRRDRR